MGRALGGLVVVAVLVVLGAVLITDRLSRPARRALRALADTAVAIGEGRLNARIRVHGPRDLVILGESINAIGERVQGLLTKEREMAADVSHRLRTPLTALRLDTETLTGAEGVRIRDAIAALEQDVDAIIRDVRPQEPAPGRGEAERACDLSEAVLDRMGFWSMLAADQGREVTLDLPEAPCLVALNRDECVAVLDSLVGNVFRYTPADGPFAVAVVRYAGWVTLIVEDAGPGIGDADYRITSIDGDEISLEVTISQTAGEQEVEAPGLDEPMLLESMKSEGKSTGRIRLDRLTPLRSEANTKSDHAHRNANSDTVMRELRLTGSTTDQNVRTTPAPSVRAACSSSSGMPDMNVVRISTANGTARVESATISPGTVLSTPVLRKMA